MCMHRCFNSLSTRDKTDEFTKSVDLDELAQNEPAHLDLHFCLLVIEFAIRYSLDLTIFRKFSDEKLSVVFGS